jgi:hypothetical protein
MRVLLKVREDSHRSASRVAGMFEDIALQKKICAYFAGASEDDSNLQSNPAEWHAQVRF